MMTPFQLAVLPGAGAASSGTRRGGAPTARPELAGAGRLIDSHGRTIRDLRLSITDRCNFRCVYCMDPGVEFAARDELLTVDELVRVARVCVGLGVKGIRLTGGEPTLHPELPRIIAGVAALGVAGLGLSDLAMTTNGSVADEGRLAAWRAAGLGRLTFSLDAVSEGAFAAMTRSRVTAAQVIAAIAAAGRAGLGPVKVNAVVVRGRNEGEVPRLAALAAELGVEMRFIEYMPLDSGRAWEPGLLVPASEVLDRVRGYAEVAPIGREEGSSTSETYVFADGRPGRIGIIAPVTRPFCGACSRLRVTADGKVRPCLFSLEEFDLRPLLRGGAGDEEVAGFLMDAAWGKQAGHGIGAPGFTQPERGMSAIGG